MSIIFATSQALSDSGKGDPDLHEGDRKEGDRRDAERRESDRRDGNRGERRGSGSDNGKYGSVYEIGVVKYFVEELSV